MNFEKIKSSIVTWREIRNDTSGFSLLSSITKIKITKEQVLNLKFTKESSHIHLYIGVDPDAVNLSPIVFLVASEYDKEETIANHSDKIIAINFQTPIFPDKVNDPYSVPETEAWERIFTWLIHKEKWFSERLLTTDKVVRTFSIPIQDFGITLQNNVDHVYLLFGIKDFSSDTRDCVKSINRTNNHDIELIICNAPGSTSIIPDTYANLTTPCPPYSCSDFGLTNLVDTSPSN